jgi:hypothetical protein
MVSKSANYCFTSPANPTGILALGEVRSSPLDLIGKESELAHASDYHQEPYGQSLTTALVHVSNICARRFFGASKLTEADASETPFQPLHLNSCLYCSMMLH